MDTISHYVVHRFGQSLQVFRQVINDFLKPAQEIKLFFGFLNFRQPWTKMLGKIKHLYQISDFHPLSPKSMLKLEESPPCQSLGHGSISKINNIDMGGTGGDQSVYFS